MLQWSNNLTEAAAMQDFLCNVIEYMNLELDTPLSELLLYIFSAHRIDDLLAIVEDIFEYDEEAFLFSNISPALDSQLPEVLAQALGKV
jgi:hypothetical protein